MDTKRAIISTLFSFTSTGTQQQVTYTVAATQAGFIAIRIRTDMTYKILKAEKVYVSPTVMDFSKTQKVDWPPIIQQFHYLIWLILVVMHMKLDT